jgi:NAD(P)-dependent dehydrogenase (short-subunit alcohol dehydrogenase family)
MTAIVTGASQGFGRGIATALAAAGEQVVGVARDPGQLDEVKSQLGGAFIPVAADAADPATAARLLDASPPHILVLNAGAAPPISPIHEQTWETFSRNWQVDVQQVFHWTKAALLRPLPPGSVVIAFSSGAALRGSPMSGGYAGAKATVRFITGYAAEESALAHLGIRFISVLPQLTPATALGERGVAAYASRAGQPVAEFIAKMGPVLTPEQAGEAVTQLVTDPARHGAYLLTSAGLSELE